MTVTTSKTGVWILDDTYKKTLDGYWEFDPSSELPGELWAWGGNNNGKLGDNTVIPRSSPIQIPGTQWIEVDAATHGLARKSV